MKKNLNKNKGSAIYLSIVIMLIMFGIGLSINNFLVKQIKLMSSIGYSVVAFYAADTGIENALYEKYFKESSETDINGTYTTLGTISNAPIGYEINIKASGTDGCEAANYCIKSIGSYRENHRAIEIKY